MEHNTFLCLQKLCLQFWQQVNWLRVRGLKQTLRQTDCAKQALRQNGLQNWFLYGMPEQNSWCKIRAQTVNVVKALQENESCELQAVFIF